MRIKTDIKQKLNIKFLACAAVCAAAAAFAVLPALAADVYYERGTKETIAGGVIYQESRKLTGDGILDVYVLTVPLNRPGVGVSPVTPKPGGGYRETSFDMLKEAGAIAGVNGDFFTTIDGDYSAAVGALIQNGKLESLNTALNTENSKSRYASFMLDDKNNPLIQYISSAMNFAINGKVIMDIASLNRTSDLSAPVCVTGDYCADTAVMDSWVKDLTKIVVQNGSVTYISKKGETVAVPPGGYIIVLNGANADTYAPGIHIGDAAKLNTWTSLNLSDIKMAISGSAILLTDGKPVQDNGYFPSGRNPRTAVGYTQDGKNLIIMAVDGRTESVGVTKAELAALMLSYGAYNAVNLDGGGSTSMAVKRPAQSIRQTNNPSDGAPRRLANSLGVFFDAEPSAPVSLLIKPAADMIFKDVGAPIYMFTQDANFQAVPINYSEAEFSSDDPAGVFKNGCFYPSKLGDVTINAQKDDLKGRTVIRSLRLAQIIPANSMLTAFMGGSVPVTLNGVSADGYTAPILAGITYTVVPAELGRVEKGVFYPQNPGAGYIKCAAGALATAFVNISVSPKPTVSTITSFDEYAQVSAGKGDAGGVSFAGYPEGVTGGVAFTDGAAGPAGSSGPSLRLDYAMAISDATQAAYAVFQPPRRLPPATQSLRISAYGDNSFVWLRARLVDSKGGGYTVDLAPQVDWTGWKDLSADIPREAVQPVSLERVYAVTQGNADVSEHSLYFDDIRVVSSASFAPVERPPDTPYTDPLAAKLGGRPKNAVDVTVAAGAVVSSDKKPKNYAAAQKQVFTAMGRDASYMLFCGSGGDPKRAGAQYTYWTPKYWLDPYPNADVINLNASGGGLIAADARQWAALTKDTAASDKPNIIIMINKSPLNFSLSEEFATFSQVMDDLVSAGKTVTVISSENTNDWARAYNGVHYFNLKGVYNGGVYNPSAQMLRLRFSDGGMQYEFQDLGLK